MQAQFAKQINDCVINSTVYNPDYDFPFIEIDNFRTTPIQVINSTSEEAIKTFNNRNNNKTMVLNFASFVNPGGMFIKGSSAQEESLCHASFLYNVLTRFGKFYKENIKLYYNSGLYDNRAIYSPDVIFYDKYLCDVLTCAAPNRSSAVFLKQKKTEAENLVALSQRINFVLNICAQQNAKNLILGAYGCGVFGQNAKQVATIFMKELTTNFKNIFYTVIFAIPKKLNYENFQTFNEIVERYK